MGTAQNQVSNQINSPPKREVQFSCACISGYVSEEGFNASPVRLCEQLLLFVRFATL